MNLKKELKTSAQGGVKSNFIALCGAALVYVVIAAWEKGTK